METSGHILFSVKSDLAHLGEVLSKFETIKKKDWIENKDWLECQLALAEGFTNAVRHAHFDKSSDTLIKIEFFWNTEEILLKIWDYGKPFDLDINAVNKAQNLAREELGIGGRGIEIMLKVADELRYEHFSDHRNCLVIRKKITSFP